MLLIQLSSHKAIPEVLIGGLRSVNTSGIKIGMTAISSEQIRAARALLRWEQRELADASGVSLPSIKRLETSPGPLAAQPRTVEAIRAALEAAGVIFVDRNGEGAGVRMALGLLITEPDFVAGYRAIENSGLARFDPTLRLQRYNDGKFLRLSLADRAIGTASYQSGEVFFSPSVAAVGSAADTIERWIRHAISEQSSSKRTARGRV
jgi:transcriptional regulator with XRE-family HTH domain